MRSRRLSFRLAATVCGLSLLAGCVADPPPVEDLRPEDDEGTSEPVVEGSDSVTIAVDSLTTGFNPHLLSDQGTGTDLVAGLVWPSAFEPGPEGELVLNEDLLDSAEVISEEPFTVRYEVAQAAQWSDSSPIGVEDFDYLWRQMSSRPGVVDPSGYELISDVRSGAGGKVVDVEFTERYDRWPGLFDNLLPAHLLRDSPEGFVTGLEDGPVVSGGHFMAHSVDLGRGEMEFVPNDRYWEAAPGLSQIVVRRSLGPSGLGQSLRSTESVVGLVADTGVHRAIAENVPGVGVAPTRASSQIELGLNVASPTTADPEVRREILDAIRPEVVAHIASGRADAAQTWFPFEPPEAPDDPDAPEEPEEGEDPGPEADAPAPDADRGDLLIGVDPGDSQSVLAANTVADQLRAAGYNVRVWELESEALYGDALPNGIVDGVVSRQPVVGDPVVAAQSRFGCAGPIQPSDDETTTTEEESPDDEEGVLPDETTRPQRELSEYPDLRPPAHDPTSTPVTTEAEETDESDDEDGDPDDAATTATETTTPERHADENTPARGANVTGYCDPETDALLDRATTTAEPEERAEALAGAAERVEDARVRLPLVTPGRLVATGPDVHGIPDPGTAGTEAGLFGTMSAWENHP